MGRDRGVGPPSECEWSGETHLPPETAALRLRSSIALSDTPSPLIVADGWLSSRPSSEMACSGIGTPDCVPSRASDEEAIREMWRVAHLGLQECLDVLEFHIWVYLHGKVLARVGDERDLHDLRL